MILRSHRDKDITYRELSQRVKDRKAALLVASHESVPRPAVAEELLRARKELRAFIARETVSS